jgi:hypothetical protein
MTLNRREKISIGVSALVLILAWVLTSGPPATPTQSASPAKKRTMVTSPEKLAVVLAHLNKAEALSEADPFTPLSKTAAAAPEDKTNALFALQGIFSDTRGKAAILNGTVIYEGRELSPGVTLLQILDKEVVIKRLDEEIRVGFEP